MNLSEMPEGVIVSAKYGNSSANGMFHRGGKAYYAEHPDDPSVLPLDEWRVIDGTAHETIATLRTRIAELEAALAKATRPAPAVGQVWRNEDGEMYAILSVDCETHVNVFECGTTLLIEGFENAKPSSSCVYVGQFAGFKIEESAE